MTKERNPKYEKAVAKAHGIIQAAIERLQSWPPDKFPYDNVRRTISNLEEIQFIPFYAEPGYGRGTEVGVMVGNCNTTIGYNHDEQVNRQARTRSMIARVFKALEHLGFAFEWCDEWVTCSNCGGAIRTNPDSYGWQRHFYVPDDGEGEVCGDCVRNDETERQNYLEWLEGNERRAMTFSLDLKSLGYVHVDQEFEHGFHHGQDADPGRIARAIRAAGGNRFIFVLDSTGQFDFKFSFWLHESEAHIMKSLRLTDDVVNGPSVSEALKRGLQNAAAVSASLPEVPGAVKYVQIRADGSAAGENIPGQEFVEHGVKLAEERLKHG